MLKLIGGILQLVMFLLSWKKEADAAKAKEREELREEAKKALANRSASDINLIVSKLRK